MMYSRGWYDRVSQYICSITIIALLCGGITPAQGSHPYQRVTLSSDSSYPEGARVTYSCSAADSIGSRWFVNGTEVKRSSLSDDEVASPFDLRCLDNRLVRGTDFFFTGNNVGIFIFYQVAPELNNTRIMCEAEFPEIQPETNDYFVPAGNEKNLVIYRLDPATNVKVYWLSERFVLPAQEQESGGFVSGSGYEEAGRPVYYNETLSESAGESGSGRDDSFKLLPYASSGKGTDESGSGVGAGLSDHRELSLLSDATMLQLLVRWNAVFSPPFSRSSQYQFKYELVITSETGEVLYERRVVPNFVQIEVPARSLVCGKLMLSLTPAHFSKRYPALRGIRHPQTRLEFSVNDIPERTLPEPLVTGDDNILKIPLPSNLNTGDNENFIAVISSSIPSVNGTAAGLWIDEGYLNIQKDTLNTSSTPSVLLAGVYSYDPERGVEAREPPPFHIDVFVEDSNITCPKAEEITTDRITTDRTTTDRTTDRITTVTMPNLITTNSAMSDFKKSWWVLVVAAQILLLSQM